MLRLKAVVAEIGADALIRVLQVLQDCNVNPAKVSAQRLLLRHQNREVMHVEVELTPTDITLDALRLVAAKIAQMPTNLSTVFGQDSNQPGHAGTQALVMPSAER